MKNKTVMIVVGVAAAFVGLYYINKKKSEQERALNLILPDKIPTKTDAGSLVNQINKNKSSIVASLTL